MIPLTYRDRNPTAYWLYATGSAICIVFFIAMFIVSCFALAKAIGELS